MYSTVHQERNAKVAPEAEGLYKQGPVQQSLRKRRRSFFQGTHKPLKMLTSLEVFCDTGDKIIRKLRAQLPWFSSPAERAIKDYLLDPRAVYGTSWGDQHSGLEAKELVIYLRLS